MDLKKEKSCGCIIIKNGKVLLVYEKNRNFWGFPKGQKKQDQMLTQMQKRDTH